MPGARVGTSKPAACASGGEDRGRSDPACPGMGTALPLSDFTQTQGAARAAARGRTSPSQHACAPVPAELWQSCSSLLEGEPSAATIHP